MVSQQRLLDVFVELADTLVDDFDAIDFLHTLTRSSVELLDADAAGLMLADQRGNLQVAASSTPTVSDCSASAQVAWTLTGTASRRIRDGSRSGVRIRRSAVPESR